MKKFQTIESGYHRFFLLLLPLVLLSCSQQREEGVKTEEGKQENVVQQTGPASRIGMIDQVSGEAYPQVTQTNLAPSPQAAPEFSWINGAGEKGSLEAYRGKVVMLNFWGTWCPPCRKELPDIVKVRDELSEKGFEVLGIALERPVNGKSVEEHLAQFAEENDLRYPMLLGTPELVEHYGSSQYVPTSFILDRQGNITSVFVGGITEGELRKIVTGLL